MSSHLTNCASARCIGSKRPCLSTNPGCGATGPRSAAPGWGCARNTVSTHSRTNIASATGFDGPSPGAVWARSPIAPRLATLGLGPRRRGRSSTGPRLSPAPQPPATRQPSRSPLRAAPQSELPFRGLWRDEAPRG
eukprot:8789448-Pyramimonas_sp.AAC.2